MRISEAHSSICLWCILHSRFLLDRYGYFQTNNSYFVCTEPPVIDKIFARLRRWAPGEVYVTRYFCLTSTKLMIYLFIKLASYPVSIAGLKITRVRDLTVGHVHDSSNPPSFEPDLPLSGGHMITFRAQQEPDLSDSLRIVLTIRYVWLYNATCI